MDRAKLLLQSMITTPSLSKFKTMLRQQNIRLKDREIKEVLQERRQPTTQRLFPRKQLKIISFHPLERVNMDIIEIQPNVKQTNKALVFIDIFSRFLWVYPMRTKTAREVKENLLKFIADAKKYGKIKTIISDDDSSFKARDINAIYKENDIIHIKINVSREDKRGHRALGVIDSAVRTLKSMIRTVRETKGRNYINFLPQIVKEYNNSPHSSLENKTPQQVIQDNDPYVRGQNTMKLAKNILNIPVFKIGEQIRIEVPQGATFRRRIGDTLYSEKVYTIVAFKERGKVEIEDDKGNKKTVSYLSMKKEPSSAISSQPQPIPRQQDVRQQRDRQRRIERELASDLSSVPASRIRQVRGQDVGVNLRPQRERIVPARFRN